MDKFLKSKSKGAEEARQKLRHMVAGDALIRDLLRIATQLETGTDIIRETRQAIPLSKERAAQLIGAAQIKQGLLRKVLPDLKAVEVTGEDGAPLEGQALDSTLLAIRLAHFLSDANAREETSVIEHQSEEPELPWLG